MTTQELQARIEQAFPGDLVKIETEECHEDHANIRVVSKQFEEKSLVEQHRLVHAALGDAVGTAVHAVTIKTFTPKQWAAAQEPAA